MTWPPPKKSAWQIKHGKRGGWVVRCRHGSEMASEHWFALVLWHASWNRAVPEHYWPPSDTATNTCQP